MSIPPLGVGKIRSSLGYLCEVGRCLGSLLNVWPDCQGSVSAPLWSFSFPYPSPEAHRLSGPSPPLPPSHSLAGRCRFRYRWHVGGMARGGVWVEGSRERIQMRMHTCFSFSLLRLVSPLPVALFIHFPPPGIDCVLFQPPFLDGSILVSFSPCPIPLSAFPKWWFSFCVPPSWHPSLSSISIPACALVACRPRLRQPNEPCSYGRYKANGQELRRQVLGRLAISMVPLNGFPPRFLPLSRQAATVAWFMMSAPCTPSQYRAIGRAPRCSPSVDNATERTVAGTYDRTVPGIGTPLHRLPSVAAPLQPPFHLASGSYRNRQRKLQPLASGLVQSDRLCAVCARHRPTRPHPLSAATPHSGWLCQQDNRLTAIQLVLPTDRRVGVLLVSRWDCFSLLVFPSLFPARMVVL